MGIGQDKMPQSSLFTEIRHFSSVNTPYIATSLWIISQVLKKLAVMTFASCFFYGVLGSPYSAIFSDITPL